MGQVGARGSESIKQSTTLSFSLSAKILPRVHNFSLKRENAAFLNIRPQIMSGQFRQSNNRPPEEKRKKTSEVSDDDVNEVSMLVDPERENKLRKMRARGKIEVEHEDK